MNILKASAGSGKTYNLAKTYITLLMESEDRYAYRHILAVTFTNKATGEMKSRILKELYTLAKDPASSPYLADLSHIDSIQAKAAALLTNILHDYGAFAISTIDAFFQQTLKCFSREIGQFSSYQIELDKKSLIHEAVDRILDNLDEGKTDLVNWLNSSVMEQVEKGGRINLEGGLYEIAERLKDEDQKKLCEELGVDESELFSKEKLKKINSECSELLTSFEEKLSENFAAFKAAFARSGFVPEDTYKGFIGAALKYDTCKRPVKAPTDAFLKRASEPDAWVSKAKVNLIPQMQKAFGKELDDIVKMFSDQFLLYKTAGVLKEQVYALGLASEFYPEFELLMKEKNVMSLDDSNTILRDIIDGSDAPFIYERMGVRFENFLLDEFQDTSYVQWHNFKPLLSESESSGRYNLVVGDVKQSIYRWRGSDWRLLGSEVGHSFPNVEERTLHENWRSCRTIVEFNNGFFNHASSVLPCADGIYSDVYQTPRSKDNQEGQVKVTFCQKADQGERVLQSVQKARKQGAKWGDIAILVRGNNEGRDLAGMLISNGIPVMSNEALDPKSSLTVRRIVSLLAYSCNERDQIYSYAANELQVEYPTNWHSLQDLCEQLLRSLMKQDPECASKDVVYIQAFMDIVNEWSATNGNNPDGFIRYWTEKSFKICSPADSDAVNIMTIHSSKGLEFKYVIFPYAENVTLYKSNTRWCKPADMGGSLRHASEGIFPIKLDSWTQNSCFRDDYANEKYLQAIDNLNIFYVALTRAEKTLHIIAAKSEAKGDEFKDLAQILYRYVGTEDFVIGNDYDFTLLERKTDSNGSDYETQYRSFPLDGRLVFGKDASDYFGEDGISTGAAASSRLAGTILHNILAAIEIPSDLSVSVRKSVDSGMISSEEAERYETLLKDRIDSALQRGWFPLQRGMTLNECSITDSLGLTHRPDRVVLTEDRTIIIDYKFGAFRKEYIDQVRRYMALFKQMGYHGVEGYLWFVESDSVSSVTI